MADCCTPGKEQAASPRRHVCPLNGKQYHEVSIKTVLQHIKTPWLADLRDQPWYFCDDPDCSAVYFSLDNRVIGKDMLRTRIGIKEKQDDALVCFCFGVTRAQARTEPSIREFVVEQTRNGLCACETRNPSGRCCLKDFPG